MDEQRCSNCQQLFASDSLLIREDNGLPVCEDCSGLLADEDLSCQYDEWT